MELLTGSNKQIEWAKSIRDKAFSAMWNEGFYCDQAEQEKAFGSLPTEAKWWIDNRKSIVVEAMEKLNLQYQTSVGQDW